MEQTQISGGASGIDGEAHFATAHQERESKRTKNVNELQVAVMQCGTDAC